MQMILTAKDRKSSYRHDETFHRVHVMDVLRVNPHLCCLNTKSSFTVVWSTYEREFEEPCQEEGQKLLRRDISAGG